MNHISLSDMHSTYLRWALSKERLISAFEVARDAPKETGQYETARSIYCCALAEFQRITPQVKENITLFRAQLVNGTYPIPDDSENDSTLQQARKYRKTLLQSCDKMQTDMASVEEFNKLKVPQLHRWRPLGGISHEEWVSYREQVNEASERLEHVKMTEGSEDRTKAYAALFFASAALKLANIQFLETLRQTEIEVLLGSHEELKELFASGSAASEAQKRSAQATILVELDEHILAIEESDGRRLGNIPGSPKHTPKAATP